MCFIRLSESEKKQVEQFLKDVSHSSTDNQFFTLMADEVFRKFNDKQKRFVKKKYSQELLKHEELIKDFNEKKNSQAYRFIDKVPNDIELVAYPTDDAQSAFIFYSKQTKRFYIYRLAPYSYGDYYVSQEKDKRVLTVTLASISLEPRYRTVIYYAEDDKIVFTDYESERSNQFTRENVTQHLELMDDEFFSRMCGEYNKTKSFLEELKKSL